MLDAANVYHEVNRPQLAMFDNVEKYLCDVLQGHYDPKKLPPFAMWREELAAIAVGRVGLYQNYD